MQHDPEAPNGMTEYLIANAAGTACCPGAFARVDPRTRTPVTNTLMATLGLATWLRLFVWLLVGLAVFHRSAAASSRMRGTPSPLARS